MATDADFFADARKRMVDSQIRPNRVTDPRILAAMRRLPREAFLPASVRALAYSDEDVAVGSGRYLIEPMVLARMLQAANLRSNERVLVIGATTGYGAALLAACGCRVTALEDDASLSAFAESVLAREAPTVNLVAGPLPAGWPALSPYDLILIEGSVPEIPATLAAQIQQESGRIIGAIRYAGGVTQAVRGEETGGGLGLSVLFDCGTPELPSFRKIPSFAF
jgi:protein-L-isoaspartate(D-aspartate) O-methyltransferase